MTRPIRAAAIQASTRAAIRAAIRASLRVAIPAGLAMLALAGAGAAQQADLVVRAGTLIDGRGGPPVHAVAVVVRDGVIRRIVPDATFVAEPGARIVDARDRYVMPGLADMHVHFNSGGLLGLDAAAVDRLMRQFLFYGVTTVLNLGATHGTPASIDRLRGGIRAGALEGPTILATGGLLTVPGSHPIGTIMHPPPGADPDTYDWTVRGIRIVDGVDETRAVVDELAAWGADAVKLVIEAGPPPFGEHRPHMSLEQASAAVAAAAAHGLPVVAHASSTYELETALDAGVDAVVHLVHHPRAPDASLLARMRDAGTYYVPTLSIFVWADVWGAPEAHLTDPFLRAGVPAHEMETLLRSPLLPRAAPAPADFDERRRVLDALLAAHRAGVRIVGGSDVANPTIFAGYSMHHELALMVEAGMTTGEAIVAATARGAEMMGDTTFGTIEPGRRADLLILRADPLADIANTRTLETVIVRGRVLDRARLLD